MEWRVSYTRGQLEDQTRRFIYLWCFHTFECTYLIGVWSCSKVSIRCSCLYHFSVMHEWTRLLNVCIPLKRLTVYCIFWIFNFLSIIFHAQHDTLFISQRTSLSFELYSRPLQASLHYISHIVSQLRATVISTSVRDSYTWCILYLHIIKYAARACFVTSFTID